MFYTTKKFLGTDLTNWFFLFYFIVIGFYFPDFVKLQIFVSGFFYTILHTDPKLVDILTSYEKVTNEQLTANQQQ
jgi:hypothetical protein